MSYHHRHDAKRDDAEPAIVDALQTAGFEVERMGKPVDLAVRRAWYPRGINVLLECKTLKPNGKFPSLDKRQEKQNSFIERGGAIRVGTPEAALEALRHWETLNAPF